MLQFLSLLLCLPSLLVLTSSNHLALDNGCELLDVALLMRDDDAVAAVTALDQAAGQDGAFEWTQSAKDGEEDGMTLSLRVMHRDSALSPFRKTGVTRGELWEERLNRDGARVEDVQERAEGLKETDMKLNKAASVSPSRKPITHARKPNRRGFSSPVVSGLVHGSGEYFTRFGVGTPAHQNYMVLDTGSDISWIQCAPCSSCYKQTDPIFNPTRSSSFQGIHCASPICNKLDIHDCEPKTNRCMYQVAYGDGSFTTGDFFLETLSFKGASLKNVALGCGHDNEGLFLGAAGLLGLGGGALSFPSQMGAQFNRTFSYCLVDRDAIGSSSSVLFGNSAIPRGTIFTRLLKNPRLSTFYYISLTGISVGGSRLTISPAAFKIDPRGIGGVIIDSGTSVTRLVEAAYAPLRAAFKAATTHLPTVGGFSLFDTCYSLSGKTSVTVPTLTLHFDKGANVSLPAKNYVIPVDSIGTFCFAFAGTSGPLSIIGNIQQQGFRVVFDGKYQRVGFSHNQCR